MQVTALPVSSSTKILSFGCNVPRDVQQHYPELFLENDDNNDPLKIQKLSNQQAVMLRPLPDVGMIENVGIVGTVTIFGRSTAMVWVGWGRLQKNHSKPASEAITGQSLGSG